MNARADPLMHRARMIGIESRNLIPAASAGFSLPAKPSIGDEGAWRRQRFEGCDYPFHFANKPLVSPFLKTTPKDRKL